MLSGEAMDDEDISPDTISCSAYISVSLLVIRRSLSFLVSLFVMTEVDEF